MTRRYSWDELIPVDETHAAAKYLAKVWKRIAKQSTKDIQYSKKEPKLTEYLHLYLNRFKAESGLTGFWVNENQVPYFDASGELKRIRKDITYFSNAKRCPIELIFEFKKLSKSSLATYRGKNGMRRFVDGEYALKQPLAVMVGILLKGKHRTVVKALSDSLSKPTIRKNLRMVDDKAGQFVRKPSNVINPVAEFDTVHRRPKDKAPPCGTTTVAHIFLLCNQ